MTARRARTPASRVETRPSRTPAGVQCTEVNTPADPVSFTEWATTSAKPGATPTVTAPASSTAGTAVMVSGIRPSRCRVSGGSPEPVISYPEPASGLGPRPPNTRAATLSTAPAVTALATTYSTVSGPPTASSVTDLPSAVPNGGR